MKKPKAAKVPTTEPEQEQEEQLAADKELAIQVALAPDSPLVQHQDQEEKEEEVTSPPLQEAEKGKPSKEN